MSVCLFANAGPLTSADLMGEASGEGLKVAYQVCFLFFFFFFPFSLSLFRKNLSP